MDMLTGVSLIGAQVWRHVFRYYISAEMLFKPMQVDGVIWKLLLWPKVRLPLRNLVFRSSSEMGMGATDLDS